MTGAAEPGKCTARWATGNGEHRAGDVCGAETTEQIGDIEVCAHHYGRALDWFYKRIEDAPGRHEEARRKAAENARLIAEARSIVYYLRREPDGLIKIGYTSNYRVRLNSLMRDHGPLRLLLATAGSRNEEDAAHKMFFAQWAAGEWFRPEVPLLRWIERQRETMRYQDKTRLPAQVPITEIRSLLRAARSTARVARKRDAVA